MTAPRTAGQAAYEAWQYRTVGVDRMTWANCGPDRREAWEAAARAALAFVANQPAAIAGVTLRTEEEFRRDVAVLVARGKQDVIATVGAALARADEDHTAKPLTRIVAHVPFANGAARVDVGQGNVERFELKDNDRSVATFDAAMPPESEET